ncbi:hypothetical protein FRC04_007985 [Tulasnella sp. 424]|nr:hypothetical protein FRC04_007985 [Tulasnella sp. 424]KAG8974843.1 hypothetical protein FRC05_006776 [Tulasnella sp. 425]
MPSGTSSRKRMIMDSDEEDVAFPPAGPSTFKRPRHSTPSVEEPQVAPSTDKGKGKEKAQSSHHSPSRPRGPPSSKPPSDTRVHRRRKTPRAVVTVTPTTSATSGDSPADSVPTLVSSDHEDDNVPGPSTSKAVVDAQPPPQTERSSDDSDELARLRKELASKDALIQKHHDAFSTLQNALQCQICLEIMWDPYIIIGIAKPYFDPSAIASESEARPVPIVPGAVAGQPVDPWVGIFPPLHRPGEGGRHRHHEEDVDGVIEDAEDHVLRCVDCLYEIFDGVCAGCGRIFNDLQDDGGFTDEDEEDEEGHPVFPFFELGLHGLFHPWHPEADPWNDEDDEVESDSGSDDDEEDNEMHDFIVSDEHEDVQEGGGRISEDDDDDVGVHGSQGRWDENHHNWNPVHDWADSEADGDEWSEQDRHDERPIQPRGPRPEDSEDERRLRSEQARERERFMYGNGEYPERAQPRDAGPSRTGSRNRLVILSDDEDDDHLVEEERSVAGESADEDNGGADRDRGRGWIDDHELYQVYSDDEEHEEDDVEQHYFEGEDGDDYGEESYY